MGLGSWLRGLFSSPAESAVDDATLHDEYETPEANAGPEAERPEVPMAIPSSGGIAPDARPGTPAEAETDEPEIEQDV